MHRAPLTGRPALFLDRDGVIIENRSNYVRSWADVDFFPQALAALARVSHSPYRVILVTNQSAVGRGLISLADADALNRRIIAHVERSGGRIDASYLCPDAPGTGTACRKPRPGMLLQAAREHHLDLTQSVMIGDALTDIEAGRAAGVSRTILLLTGRGREQSRLPAAAALAPLTICADLAAALALIIP